MNIIVGIKKSGIKNGIKSFFASWLKNGDIVFIVVFIIFSCYGTFLMYQSLYISDWTEEEKNNYISSQQKNIQLKEGRLAEIIAEIDRRRMETRREIDSVDNIFIIEELGDVN